MKISVQVKLNSKKEMIEKLPDGSYLIRIRVPPVEGKANERIIEILSEHLNRPKTSFQLISGHKGKKKIFNVE